MRPVGELVLDRLEFSDRLPELVTLLGVVHGQLERPPGRAMCPRQQCAAWALRRRSSRSAPSSGRSVSGTEFSLTSQRPQAPMARVGTRIDAGSIQLDEGKAGLVDGHEKMRGTGRLDEAKHACSAPIVNADRARARIRIAGAEGESGHRRAGVQLFQQFPRGVGPSSPRAQDWPARWTTSAPDMRRGQVPPSPPGFREGRLRRGWSPARRPPARRACARSQRYHPATAVPCTPPAAQCASRNPRRESRSISAVSSLGSPVASMRDYA